MIFARLSSEWPDPDWRVRGNVGSFCFDIKTFIVYAIKTGSFAIRQRFGFTAWVGPPRAIFLPLVFLLFIVRFYELPYHKKRIPGRIIA